MRIKLIPLVLCFFALSCKHDDGTSTTQPIFAPFAGDIAVFEAADAKSPPPQNAILFLGSSSIRLWKTLEQDFPNVKIINRGFGGSTIPDSTRYVDRIVAPYHPRQIIFYAGDNDIAALHSPETVLSDYKVMVQRIHAALPNTRIEFISIKPSIQRWLLIGKIRDANRLIEEYTKTDEKLGYIDIFTLMLNESGQPKSDLFQIDGLHLSKKGYELWASIVGPRLMKE